VSDALVGVRVKLDRAREHLDTLKGEFDAFMKPETNAPWAVQFKIDTGAGKCEIGWRQDTAPDPRPRWAAIFGEFLYDVRSSLDHIARDLVVANGRKPDGRTEFPVFKSQDDFEGRSCPKTRGMSEHAKTLIESLQPYRAWPEHPTSSTLWKIHELCNIDKHRTLNLSDPWLMTVKVVFRLPGKVREDIITASKRPKAMRLYDKAVIGEFVWDPAELRSLSKSQVKVEFEASLDISLAEGNWLTCSNKPRQGGMAVRHVMEVSLDYIDTVILPEFTSLLGAT
jgi:hypothetical protein